MSSRFEWYEFDVRNLLPNNWDQEITEVALNHAISKTLTPTSVTSRELLPELRLPVMTVGGRLIQSKLPWLFDLYTNEFRNFGQRCAPETLLPAEDPRYAVNLNLQCGSTMRYECHVDSNPLEALLYVTTHPIGSGGDLIVSKNPAARGPDEIEADCFRLQPKSGTLLFFDAREYPHFVAPLSDHDAVRVVVAMNYYTQSCPEASRPADLNKHLGIE